MCNERKEALHATDSSVAEKTMSDKPISLPVEEWAKIVWEAENMTDSWEELLVNSSEVQYHRLNYESLLGIGREAKKGRTRREPIQRAAVGARRPCQPLPYPAICSESTLQSRVE